MAGISDTIRELERLAAGGAGDAAREVSELVDQIGRLDDATTDSRAALTGLRRDLAELIKTEQQRRALGNEVVDSINRQITVLEQLRAKIFDLSSAYDTQRERIRGLMGIGRQWETSTLGIMTKIIAEGKGVGAAFRAITTEMHGAVSNTEMLTSSVMKMQELGGASLAAVTKGTYDLAIGLDSARVSLSRTTGASRQYGQMIVDLEKDLNTYGVTADQAAHAVGSLYSGMTGFTQMTRSSRDQVARSVSILQTMGIAAETSTANLEIMNRAMGLSGPQAAALNQEMYRAAQQLGISTTKMMSDFGTIGPQLIKFGQEATRVYIGLQSTAKNTGIEVSRLLSITEQFDKFDTAAESVGRLNAILGGPYLNSIQMVMTTDPTARLQMMSRAVKASGQNFDSMSYYMRQATASAMGLQDVNELAMLMRGRMDLLGSSTTKSSRDIEKMMAETQRYNTVADEMRQVMRQVVISMEPFIGYLKSALNWLQKHPGAIQGVVAALAAFKAFSAAATFVAMLSTALGAVSGSLMAILGPIAILVGAAGIGYLATQMASAGRAAEVGSVGVNRLSAASRGLVDQQSGLAATAAAYGQIGATIDAIPERKTTQWTMMLDKTAIAGRIEAAGAGTIGSYAQAMYRPPSPQTQVRQPIKVHLDMDARTIGSQVVDVIMQG